MRSFKYMPISQPFSKVPIINGPVKLLLFIIFKLEVTIVLHLT